MASPFIVSTQNSTHRIRRHRPSGRDWTIKQSTTRGTLLSLRREQVGTHTHTHTHIWLFGIARSLRAHCAPAFFSLSIALCSSAFLFSFLFLLLLLLFFFSLLCVCGCVRSPIYRCGLQCDSDSRLSSRHFRGPRQHHIQYPRTESSRCKAGKY